MLPDHAKTGTVLRGRWWRPIHPQKRAFLREGVALLSRIRSRVAATRPRQPSLTRQGPPGLCGFAAGQRPVGSKRRRSAPRPSRTAPVFRDECAAARAGLAFRPPRPAGHARAPRPARGGRCGPNGNLSGGMPSAVASRARPCQALVSRARRGHQPPAGDSRPGQGSGVSGFCVSGDPHV